MPKDYPWGKGTPKWVLDSTANDSDKSFTVPTGKVWDLRYISAILVATATVGTRSLRCNITTPAGSVFTAYLAGITASQSGNLVLGQGFSYNNAFTSAGTYNQGYSYPLMLPPFPEGSVVRLWDAAAIDAAADDLTVVLHYVEYDA